MTLRIKAEYVDGKLNPLEPLDLREGALVTVSITEEPDSQEHESILEATDRLLRSSPPDTWDNSPTDGAKNYRHYLYGHPREEE